MDTSELEKFATVLGRIQDRHVSNADLFLGKPALSHKTLPVFYLFFPNDSEADPKTFLRFKFLYTFKYPNTIMNIFATRLL